MEAHCNAKGERIALENRHSYTIFINDSLIFVMREIFYFSMEKASSQGAGSRPFFEIQNLTQNILSITLKFC